MEYQNARFAVFFADVPDPRRNHGQLRHNLLDIMTIALCAVLCGAESFVEMAEFGRAKQEWRHEHRGLHWPHGVSSQDTCGRLLARLDPQAFEQCFVQWTQALHTLTQGQVIAVGGKTLRRSFDKATGQAALHWVRAALGQRLGQ